MVLIQINSELNYLNIIIFSLPNITGKMFTFNLSNITVFITQKYTLQNSYSYSYSYVDVDAVYSIDMLYTST
jgi:hypothetical protein